MWLQHNRRERRQTQWKEVIDMKTETYIDSIPGKVSTAMLGGRGGGGGRQQAGRDVSRKKEIQRTTTCFNSPHYVFFPSLMEHLSD